MTFRFLTLCVSVSTLFVQGLSAAPNKAEQRLDPAEAESVTERAVRSTATVQPTETPWVYRSHLPETADEKYLRYSEAQGSSGAIGRWPTNVINWRYNDAGRPSGLVGSSQAARDLINVAMARWTSQCGVSFNYLGTSSNGPSLTTTPASFDNVNVIGWGPLAGNTTGVTGIGGTGTQITEGDIVLNNQFNPDLLSTIIHEVGHYLGLRHSDVSGAMMSGPPLTSYSGTTSLQSDDIAGCRSMFGVPASSPTIAGSISLFAGGSVPAGTTFCANPSSGVNCGSATGGTYSCTVPSGWTGTLHLQAGNTLRVAARRFTSGVTTAQTGENFVVYNADALQNSYGFFCNLDIDNNGLNEASIDGVMVMRKLVGVTGPLQTVSTSGVCAQRNTAADRVAFLADQNYDINNSGGAQPLRDGLILLRLMLGMTGTQAVAGSGLTWANVQTQLNNNCGTSF
jgi:hypothetical protein